VEFCRIVANSKIKRSFTDSFTDTRPLKNRKLLEICHLKMEPAAGIEPATFALRKQNNSCTTTPQTDTLPA